MKVIFKVDVETMLVEEITFQFHKMGEISGLSEHC